MTKDTKDFKIRQFSCNHCEANHVTQVLIDKIQEIKDTIDMNVYIISAYRCKLHNKNLGGRKGYNQGLIADIKVTDKDDKQVSAKEVVDIIDDYGIMNDYGIGEGEGIITIDLSVGYERWER